ncbi:MAG: AMP-binding protein [Sphingomonadales bacterium]|nr:AMP-binding protein [Sphingomonadales bacterium]
MVRETDRIVAALKTLGIGRGDVVGLYMPLMPEAASAVLAVARIGGIIMPLFSGFGADAISTRLNDGEAKAVITVDGCYRRGRRIAMKPIMDEALTKVPSVKSVLVISRFGEKSELVPGRDHHLDDLVKGTRPRPSRRSFRPILPACSSTRRAPPASRKARCIRTSACRSRSSRISSSAST